MRTPTDIRVEWPTAGEIARAIVSAANLTEEDPIDVVLNRKMASKARALAFVAVAHQFPTATRTRLSRLFGSWSTSNGTRAALRGNTWPWFSIGRLNAVRAACGWPDMTIAQAVDAPLIFCGRPWTEFRLLAGGVDSVGTETPPKQPESAPDTKQSAAVRAAPKDEVFFEPAETEIADRDDLTERAARAQRTKAWVTGATIRAAEIGRRTTSYRPDLPAENLGGVSVTASLMGDPDPSRSALGQRR